MSNVLINPRYVVFPLRSREAQHDEITKYFEKVRIYISPEWKQNAAKILD